MVYAFIAFVIGIAALFLKGRIRTAISLLAVPIFVCMMAFCGLTSLEAFTDHPLENTLVTVLCAGFSAVMAAMVLCFVTGFGTLSSRTP